MKAKWSQVENYMQRRADLIPNLFEAAKAAGVTLDDDVLKRIDDVLGDVVERNPAKTQRG